MSDYASAAASVNAGGSPVPEKSKNLCCVNGCQMPGTLAASTTGSTEWFCRLHFGAQYSENGQITALAKNRDRLYRLAFRCTNATPGKAIPKELRDALVREGRADLLDAKPAIDGRPLTIKTLGRHMLEVLDSESKPGQKALKPADAKTSQEGLWATTAEMNIAEELGL